MNDLRQLRHFVALAEHEHFARAAAAVHLSQPALSRSIQALESQLGCTLVDRHSRGVSLTAHGRLVLEHARRLLAGSLALSNAVNQLGNLQAGELRLGAGPYPAARLIPQALGQLLQRYPRVQVKLDIANWLELRDSLLDSAIELFVADIRELQDDAQLHIEPCACMKACCSVARLTRCCSGTTCNCATCSTSPWPARNCRRWSNAAWARPAGARSR